MATVQAVNGFGQATSRSVVRPYGYGRGLMSVDPAYAPFMSGRYAPVRVSYQDVRVRAGKEDYWEERGITPPEPSAPGVTTPSGVTYTPSGAPTSQAAQRGPAGPTGGPARDIADRLNPQRGGGGGRMSVPYARRDSGGAKLVPQPEAGGKQPKKSIDEIQGNIAKGIGSSLARSIGGPGATTNKPGTTGGKPVTTTTTTTTGKRTKESLDLEAQNNARLKNLPQGSFRIAPDMTTSAGRFIDAGNMEAIRDIAVRKYVSENNEWAKNRNGKPVGVPLIQGKDTYTTDKLPFSQIASMMQVEREDIPWQQKPKDYSGQGFADQYKNVAKYTTYAPAYTVASANNSFYDLGLNRAENIGEITNWKRTFDALGFYAEGARPNLNSTGWGYYENAAMAEFMKVLNSNPKAYQSAADLRKGREEMLSIAGQMAKKSAAESGSGGQTFPFTQTQTNTNVQISNLEDARETLRGQITNMIGRFPTDAEVKQFLGKLNDYERAHPTSSTTTTTYSDANTSTSSTTGSRGDAIDPFKVSQDFAKQEAGGDYHAYQQLRYYQAISDIIASPQGIQNIPQEM